MGRLRNIFLAALVLSVAALGSEHARANSMSSFIGAQRYEDVFYAPPSDWISVFSLGHYEALADIMWVKGLIYFGEGFGNKSAMVHIFRYVDALITLDPNFERAYRWAGTAGIYKTVEASLDELRSTAKYVEMGVKQFPDSGEMAWEAGSTLMFEVVPKITDDPEEKRAVRARATRYLEKAARLGAGPEWLVLANLRNLKRLGQTERAVAHLEEIYLSTSDPALKKEISGHLIRLKNASFAEGLRVANEGLRRRHRQTAPYLSLGLFELVYPR